MVTSFCSHYYRSKATARAVDLPARSFFHENHCDAQLCPCSDSGHVTAPYKLSFYYYYFLLKHFVNLTFSAASAINKTAATCRHT